MEHAKQFDTIRPIRWRGSFLELLDQRLLPFEERYQRVDSVEGVHEAIASMVVRGAPAIGITAAYGVVLSARAHFAKGARHWSPGLADDIERLRAARPTAVNLGWALDRMRALAESVTDDPREILLDEARRIHESDIVNNRLMGELGAGVLMPDSQVLTHCNAGALATGGYGTALGVVRAGFAQGKIEQVFADETRPWLQGSRLTAWELVKERIPVQLIADGASSQLMAEGSVSWVIVGADRVAANGDVANKIGTYGLAISARYHGVRFMVVAPTSTIDRATHRGVDIPIERRAEEELLSVGGQLVAAPGARGRNFVFDVTPASLIDLLVTEKGLVEKPNRERIAELFSD